MTEVRFILCKTVSLLRQRNQFFFFPLNLDICYPMTGNYYLSLGDSVLLHLNIYLHLLEEQITPGKMCKSDSVFTPYNKGYQLDGDCHSPTCGTLLKSYMQCYVIFQKPDTYDYLDSQILFCRWKWKFPYKTIIIIINLPLVRRIKFWGKKCWKSWMGAEFLFVLEWKQSCPETKFWWSLS